jgi:lysozyme
MRRNTSPRGIALIQSFEGFSPTVYTCPAGKPTIGWGHVVRKLDKIAPPITKDQAAALLVEDLAPTEIYLGAILPDLPQHQFDALCSFAYNIGLTNFETSTLLRKLKAGDIDGAAKEFVRWVNVQGKPLDGLKRRRAAERDMFVGR